jgi:hypothetical protein
MGSPSAIGEPVGSINGTFQKAADINVIEKLTKLTTVNPGEVVSNTLVVGWEYKDRLGNYWLQWNPATEHSWTWSAGYIVSVAVTLPPDSSYQYIGRDPAKLELGMTYIQCWEKGERFGS